MMRTIKRKAKGIARMSQAGFSKAIGSSPPLPLPESRPSSDGKRYCRCCMEVGRKLVSVEFQDERGIYRVLWCRGPRCLYFFAGEFFNGNGLIRP